MTITTEAGPDPRTTTIAIDYGVSGNAVERRLTLDDGAFVEDSASLPTTQRGEAFAAWWSAFIREPRRAPSRSASPVRVVDLFSSVGGLTLGAFDAISALGGRGVSLLAADVDERALQVYRANFRPRQVAQESVRGMLDFRVIGAGDSARFAYAPTVTDARLGDFHETVDLVLAGPPCQGHSSLNNHSRHEDPKNLLYLTVPAAAIALNARHIVIENVPNVVADRHGVVQTTMALLREAGYHLSSGVLAADRLGWPQTRKRFFLVASRDSVPLSLDALSQNFARDPLAVSWLLDDLKDRPLDDGDIMSSVPQLSRENEMRVNWLHENGEYDLPNAIRPDCHREGTTYPATYGRMRQDLPAPTITGGFLTPGRGRFVHPSLRRVLTPREAARIQGFPDWFSFVANDSEPPSRTEISRWIGNAVPSLLGSVATLAALAGDERVRSSVNEINQHAA